MQHCPIIKVYGVRFMVYGLCWCMVIFEFAFDKRLVSLKEALLRQQ